MRCCWHRLRRCWTCCCAAAERYHGPGRAQERHVRGPGHPVPCNGVAPAASTSLVLQGLLTTGIASVERRDRADAHVTTIDARDVKLMVKLEF